MLWISCGDGECRIVVNIAVTIAVTIAELILLGVKWSTAELAGRKGKGGCG